MHQEEPDIFDIHDREIKHIIYLIKRVALQDPAHVYSKRPSLEAVADSIRDMDARFFKDLVDAMRKIDQERPVVPGKAYPTL